ncbi:MAG: VanZ family protein [Desulfococcaceae bacterium]
MSAENEKLCPDFFAENLPSRMRQVKETKFPVNRISKLFILYWMPVLVYCLLIYVQSEFPSPFRLPKSLPQGDKLLHFAGYALLGFLFFRAFHASLPRKSTVFIVCISILASAVYGAADEFHQSFVRYRTSDIMDFMADMMGAVTGVWAYCLAFAGGIPAEHEIAD